MRAKYNQAMFWEMRYTVRIWPSKPVFAPVTKRCSKQGRSCSRVPSTRSVVPIPSWHGAIHALGGLFVFVVLAAALGVFVRFFLERQERRWAFDCLASAVLLILFFFGLYRTWRRKPPSLMPDSQAPEPENQASMTGRSQPLLICLSKETQLQIIPSVRSNKQKCEICPPFFFFGSTMSIDTYRAKDEAPS